MATSDRLLRVFARALPREFRERVFEPALADIRLDDRDTPRPFARAILVLECLRIGVPQHMWCRGRPTRAAVILVAALLLGSYAAARLRYAAEWKGEARDGALVHRTR